MRVRGVDLDRPGLPVWLEGRPFRIAAVKRAFPKVEPTGQSSPWGTRGVISPKPFRANVRVADHQLGAGSADVATLFESNPAFGERAG